MPRAPITPSIVAGPVGRSTYSPQNPVQPVQPQQPGMLVQQGQQLQRLGGALEDVAEVQRIKQVRALATELDTKLAESFRTSKSEFGKLQGRKAVEAFPEYEKSIRDSAKKMLEGVTDPLAQRLIRESAEQRIQQNLNEATAHRDRQQEVWMDGAEKAAVQGSVEDYKVGVQNGDPDADRFFVTALDQQRRMDERKGLSPEQRRINELGLTTALHGGVVDGMIERGEGIKAFQYIETNKKEMAADFYAERFQRAKGKFIQESARKMDATIPTFRERVAAVQALEGVDESDKAMAIAHLENFQQQRDIVFSRSANEARRQIAQMMAENPSLPTSALPEAAALARQYNLQLDRVNDNPEFVAAMRVPANMDRLRSMPDDVLEYELSNNLTPRSASDAFKFIRGDQSGVTINQLTKGLALDVGVIALGDKEADANKKLLDWEARTIAPIVAAKRTELGRNLTPTEFQEFVVNPIMQDKVWISGFWGGTEMTVMKAQQLKYMPVDDPRTPGKDESLDIINKNVYVKVGGQEVYLREIPLEERRAMRIAWKRRNPNQPMTTVDEVTEWVANGRPGDRKEEIKKKESPEYPAGTYGMTTYPY